MPGKEHNRHVAPGQNPLCGLGPVHALAAEIYIHEHEIGLMPNGFRDCVLGPGAIEHVVAVALQDAAFSRSIAAFSTRLTILTVEYRYSF